MSRLQHLVAATLLAALITASLAHFEDDGSVPGEGSTTAVGDPTANEGEVGPQPGSPAAMAAEETGVNGPNDDTMPSVPGASPVPGVVDPAATPVPGAVDPAMSTDDADDSTPEASVVEPEDLEETAEPTAEETPDVEASPSVEEDDDGSACFPGSATVELKDGTTKRMDELSVGDVVRTGATSFSKIFMFTHKDSSISGNFLTIETASGSALTVTKNHYVYSDGSLVASQNIALFSKLMLASGNEDEVVAISRAPGLGLYNPQTVDGDIVVDGVLASTYTTDVEPTLAHGLLAPFRAAYNIFGLYTTAFNTGSQQLAHVAPNGAQILV